MRIRCNSPKAAPRNEWKTSQGIMIRGGNHHMNHGIYIPLSKDMLVKMGFLKEGEEPNDDTASKVKRALDIEVRKDPGDKFGPDYYMTLSIGDIKEEYKLETYWAAQALRQGLDSFINWMRNVHLTIRPEEVYESRGRAEAHDLREYCLDIWLTLTKDMGKSSSEADSLIESNPVAIQDYFDEGTGPVVAAQRIAGVTKNESDIDTVFSAGFTLKRDGNTVRLTGHGVDKNWKCADAASAKSRFSAVWDTLTYFSYGRISLKDLEQRLDIKVKV